GCVPNKWNGCIRHWLWAVGSPVGRLWTADSGNGGHADRAGRGEHVSSPPLQESGPRAAATAGGSNRLILRPGGQEPEQGWPRGGGQQVGRVRRPAPFYQAVASAAARGDHPDSLYGTVVWDPAG